MTNATITIHLDQPIATISPFLHGHFIEHLGACIYDGIWIGEDSQIANINGVRRDVVEALRRIQPPVFRWPGGCFADTYRWEDGVGPRTDRPIRATNRWGADEIEGNAFGTHEFIEFCRLVGAEPWLGGNIGSGTPRELSDWVEYCNFAGDTTLSRLRAANGAPEPFGVRFWGIGNESWDCGGKFRPATYADAYKRFESHFPRFHGQPVFLIACGPDGNKAHENAAWTRQFFSHINKWRAPRLDGYDAHFYIWNSQNEAGSATAYDVEQWYQLIGQSLEIESLILQQRALLDEWDGQRRVGLIIGEWGVWHGQTHEISLYRQQNTLRDALIAATTLDLFHRHADKLFMANLAQTVNVLHALILTDHERMVLTPTYHVFDMYQAHKGGRSVHVDFAADAIRFGTVGSERELPGLWGSASTKNDVLTLSVVNPHAVAAVAANISIGGGSIAGTIDVAQLSHPDIRAHNTFDQPNTLMPSRTTLRTAAGKPWQHSFPPASVTVFRAGLRGGTDS